MIYGYIRVSSDKQTVENQRFEINKFCERQNMKIDGWIEETISGTKSYNKRELGKLLNKVKKDDHLKFTIAISAFGKNEFVYAAQLTEDALNFVEFPGRVGKVCLVDFNGQRFAIAPDAWLICFPASIEYVFLSDDEFRSRYATQQEMPERFRRLAEAMPSYDEWLAKVTLASSKRCSNLTH